MIYVLNSTNFIHFDKMFIIVNLILSFGFFSRDNKITSLLQWMSH